MGRQSHHNYQAELEVYMEIIQIALFGVCTLGIFVGITLWEIKSNLDEIVKILESKP